jgi:hypothetical protein
VQSVSGGFFSPFFGPGGPVGRGFDQRSSLSSPRIIGQISTLRKKMSTHS